MAWMRSRMAATSASQLARSAGSVSTRLTMPAGMDGGAGIVAPHRGLELAQHQLGLGPRRGTPGSARRRVRRRRSCSWKTSWRRRRSARHRPARARQRRLRRCRRRSPGRPGPGRAAGRGPQHRDQRRPLRRRQVHARWGCGSRRAAAPRCAAAGRAAQPSMASKAQAAGGRVVVRVGVDRDTAPSNMARWLSQVGSLTQTWLSGSQRLMKSAPTFSPPLEPTVCSVATRRSLSASCPAPNSSACTALRRRRCLPSAGRAWGRLRPASAPRPVHAGQHRDAAGVVEVDADRQVDLVAARVLLEGFVQAQDGVAGIGLDVAEHGAVLVWVGRGRWPLSGGCSRLQAAARAFSMSLRSDSGVSLGA
jgi:hypothetical protein